MKLVLVIVGYLTLYGFAGAIIGRFIGQGLAELHNRYNDRKERQNEEIHAKRNDEIERTVNEQYWRQGKMKHGGWNW
jgi:hypothetical protein